MRPLYDLPRCKCGGKAHLTDNGYNRKAGETYDAKVSCDQCGKAATSKASTLHIARVAAIARWREGI